MSPPSPTDRRNLASTLLGALSVPPSDLGMSPLSGGSGARSDPAAPLRPEMSVVLTAAAVALHGEPDLDRAVRWAVQAAADLAGTPEVGICVRGRDTTPTWTCHPDAATRFDVLGDPRSHPSLQRILTDNVAILVDAIEGPTHGPSLLSSLRAASALVLPVAGRDQSVVALIVVCAESPPTVAASEALTALAAHLGVAIENHTALARLAEEQARGEEVVHRLQEAVRPPAPAVAHTELGVRYVAADPSAPTGGDLYDWITLPDGSLHFTVVDVMGKGVEATKHALAVTHALRLLVLEGCPMGDIVARADRLVTGQNPDLVATLIVGRYWPEDGRVLLAGAGHPPALLVAAGHVREISLGGIPLGWPGASSETLVELHLDRHDTLILYTDGLIEATKDIVEGLAKLAASARATAGYPANAMARALVDRQLENALRRDDSLALIVRRRLPPPQQGVRALAPLVHRLSPSTAAVPLARHLLADWLQHLPIDADAIDAVLLVASELLGNAVRHANAGQGGICLRAEARDHDVVLEVSDDGGQPVYIAESTPLPDGDAERGRGLFLVQELVDDLCASTADGLTTVTAVWRDILASGHLTKGS